MFKRYEECEVKIFFSIKFISIMYFLLVTTSVWATQLLDNQQIERLSIANLKQPTANIFTSGQPTKAQLAELQRLGIKHVISLRSVDELAWSESEYVTQLKMAYHSIPVSGISGITDKNAIALNQLLNKIGNEPVLLHCASSNRVGALIALQTFQENGKDIDGAIAEAKRWGLTGLETIVRGILYTK